ncbi:MAG: pilus assembly protein PilF [Idiomarina sp.]|nr:pilus assembly protein PilF [Idiomarina sp.]
MPAARRFATTLRLLLLFEPQLSLNSRSGRRLAAKSRAAGTNSRREATKSKGMHTMKIAILLWLAMLAGCSLTPNAELSDAGKTRLQLGLEYMQRDQLERARPHLDKAYNDAPRSEAVIIALGQWYLRKEKVNSALLLYQQALSWQPNSGAMYNNYAIALCVAGYRQQAMLMFDQAESLQQQVAANRKQCSLLKTRHRYAEASQ